MTLHPVSSNDIVGVNYERGNMYVKLASGGLYLFRDVPVSVYNEFVESPCPGGYFHARIKGKYYFKQVE